MPRRLLSLAEARRIALAARGSDRLRPSGRVDARHLREVCVDGWTEKAYLSSDARLRRRIETTALISPFDPLVWYRARTARPSDFDDRVEIFFPPSKRRWGYYVLPFLFGDRLVARVDLEADRGGRRLRVPAAHIEAGEDTEAVAGALGTESKTMATRLGLEAVTVELRGNLASRLGAAVGG